MSVFSSPTMLVSFAVIVVGCVLIWLITRSGKSRPQNENFSIPQSGTSAFSDSDSMGQATFSDSVTQSEGYSPQGLPDSGRPFAMTIEDVFSITGRGLIVTGRVSFGSLRVGDDVEIVGPHRTCRATVAGIEKFRKTVDSISTGEIGGLLLRGVTSDEIERGHVVVAMGTATSHGDASSHVPVVDAINPLSVHTENPSGSTSFSSRGDCDVVLEVVGDSKAAVIKEVRVITNLGLLEAKNLVDSAPCVVAKSVSREDAERISRRFESVGARVTIK